MVRIKSAVSSRKRKKRILKATKGQFAHRSRRYRQAVRSLTKGQTYAFRDRKVRKREFRSLWIVRINAACREGGISYSRFIKGLQTAKIAIDRKMLSDLAVTAPDVFNQLIKTAQEALGSTTPKSPKVAKA